MLRASFSLAILITSLVATAISYAVWSKRKAQAKVRLQEIDEGRRCIACDGTNLEHIGGEARCLRCGHMVSLASLRAAIVGAHEIENVTKPNDRTN